jgi:hypothetical protein
MADAPHLPLCRRQLFSNASKTFEELLEESGPVCTQTSERLDEAGSLQAHTALNLTFFDEAFPGLTVDEDSGMLMKPNGRFLLSSHVDQYYYVLPALYRDNCAIMDISFDDLMVKLSKYKSEHPRQEYSRILIAMRSRYRRIFKNVAGKSDIMVRLISLLSIIASQVDDSTDVTSASQRLSAASRHLAKRVGNTEAVDHNAGVAGMCDLLFFFGHGEQKHSPLCSVEIEFIDGFSPDKRWFTQCGAVLAQVTFCCFDDE